MTKRTRELPSARPTAFPGELALRFPFRRELVDALKEAVPGRHRRWDADEKAWYVTAPHLETAVQILIAHHPDAQLPEAYAHLAPRRMARRKVTARPRRVAAWSDPIASLQRVPASPDQTTIAITCPCCHGDFEQLIRITAQSSAKAAKRDCTPEFVAVCPHCNALNVVAFVPAPSNARVS